MTDYDRIKNVITYLEDHHSEQPNLTTLARVAKLSPFHFHRMLKKWAGITPKDFLQFLTLEHAKELLSESRDLLSASLETGLSGPGRLHDLFVAIEGVSPGEYKSKGLGIEIDFGFHPTPFGQCLIGVTRRGVCYLGFVTGTERELLSELQEKWSNAELKCDQKKTRDVINEIFLTKKKRKPSLLLMGTPFQIKIWQALLLIPEGHLASYGDVAKAIGSRKASRAVGTAIGANAISWLIPCHRVIRDNGKFNHYRWGPERKKAMLVWEMGRRS